MSEYELVKKLGSYDNFKGLKSMAKVPRHKLLVWNKLSAPNVNGRLCHIRNIINIFKGMHTGRCRRAEKSHQHVVYHFL